MIDFATVETLLRSPYVFTTGGIVVLVYFINWFINAPKKLDLPWAAPPKNGSLIESFKEASEKYPDSAYLLPADVAPHVMLPLSLFDEVKSLPDSMLSITKDISHRMAGKYTEVAKPHPELLDAIRVEVARKNADQILDEAQDEINHFLDNSFGPFPQWTETVLYPKVLMLVAAFSARTFVGLPLCRDQAWLGNSIKFTVDVMTAVRAVNKKPWYLRPFVAPFMKELKALSAGFDFAARKLEPTIAPIVAAYKEKAKMSANSRGRTNVSEDAKGQMNIIYWTLNHYRKPERANAAVLAKEQMALAFASIHTTGMRTQNALLDLAAYPEYAAEIRKEYEEVEREEGNLGRGSLAKLKKLDSFLLESTRCNPTNLTGFRRLVIAPGGITLSNGQYLPYNTSIAFPSLLAPQALNPPPNSPLAAAGQPSLSEFHPFRFAELREQPGNADKFQFTSLTPDNINFGAGIHACPGRFFATNNVKSVIVEILKRYELGLLNGGRGGAKGVKEGGTRPASIAMGTGFIVNPGGKIWIRERKK